MGRYCRELAEIGGERVFFGLAARLRHMNRRQDGRAETGRIGHAGGDAYACLGQTPSSLSVSLGVSLSDSTSRSPREPFVAVICKPMRRPTAT